METESLRQTLGLRSVIEILGVAMSLDLAGYMGDTIYAKTEEYGPLREYLLNLTYPPHPARVMAPDMIFIGNHEIRREA